LSVIKYLILYFVSFFALPWALHEATGATSDELTGEGATRDK